jgi:hypothetical protein
MTYADAQTALEALCTTRSIPAAEGRSLSELLTLLIASNPPTDLNEGTAFDISLRDALGITA